MIHKGHLYLFVFIALQVQFLPVSSDLRIVDPWSNKVVFQTASDFVRTGCGTFVEQSRLVASDPPNACDIPSSPPLKSLLSRYIFGANEDITNGELQWVLFAKDGGCDLKTKFRNAASAGYSAIIVGTDEKHEEITHPGIFGEDDEEFIDVHLVHSLDIRVLLKETAKNQNLLVQPPHRSRCKDEYHRTWLRSRFVSMVIRTWKRSMDICWQCILWTLLLLGKIAKTLKSLLPSVLYSRDTLSSIAFYLASIFVAITIMMIISIRNTAQKISKYKSFQEERRNSFSEEKCVSGPSGPSPKPNTNHRYRSPPSQAHCPPIYYQQRASLDYTIRHRLNLNIDINEPLTKTKVNIAYRDMALKYHPDKNVHLDQTELAKITEEFRSKKRSRDMLLIYCKE